MPLGPAQGPCAEGALRKRLVSSFAEDQAGDVLVAGISRVRGRAKPLTAPGPSDRTRTSLGRSPPLVSPPDQ